MAAELAHRQEETNEVKVDFMERDHVQLHIYFQVLIVDSSSDQQQKNEHMKRDFFLPFPKPGKNLKTCKLWVQACLQWKK